MVSRRSILFVIQMFVTVLKTTHHLPDFSSPYTTALFKYVHQNFLYISPFDERNIDF